MTRPARAVLVGPNQQENLALQYLAAAAEQAGHQAELVAFNTRDDLGSAVDAVLARAPDVVGLGIAFQYCIDDYLLFARTLRERGYCGHITCGGHVPTFCCAELLRDAPALDSVVRHDGEQTFSELLDRVSSGASVAGLAGLAWRQGDGVEVGPIRAPTADLDELPWPKRGSIPYRVAGVPIAFLITARGCVGECAYCSIRAYGHSAGGPAYRVRDPAAAAAEVSELYHRGRVRIFFVQDDLFVLPNEAQTCRRMSALTAALRDRDVNDVAFWIKGRPESITPAVLEAARELGAVHLFLGLESACADRLAYLGRTHRPADNRRALGLCRAHGVKPSFNFMLFDPDCTLDQVAETLDFADQNLDLPWNVCRTEIYSGTRLLDRLQAEGRLQGDYRTYGYRMVDPRAELMFRILRVCLHDHAFAFDSLLNRLISLSFARQVHQRFFPCGATTRLAHEIETLLVETHRDTVATLRRALDFAAHADLEDASAATTFSTQTGLELGARDARRRAHAAALWEEAHMQGMARFRAQLAGHAPSVGG